MVQREEPTGMAPAGECIIEMCNPRAARGAARLCVCVMERAELHHSLHGRASESGEEERRRKEEGRRMRGRRRRRDAAVTG